MNQNKSCCFFSPNLLILKLLLNQNKKPIQTFRVFFLLRLLCPEYPVQERGAGGADREEPVLRPGRGGDAVRHGSHQETPPLCQPSQDALAQGGLPVGACANTFGGWLVLR